MLDMSFTENLGRGYRYWQGDAPLWSFGHGLSLTEFGLGWHGAGMGAAPPAPLVVTSASQTIRLSLDVTNTGSRNGDEVVMLFHEPDLNVTRPASETVRLPARRLVDFARAGSLAAGAATALHFALNASTALGLVDSEGSTYLYAGGHRLVSSRGHGAELSQAVTVQLDAPALIDTLL